MYENSPADLHMTRVVLAEAEFDRTLHQCNIVTYNPEEESIYLLVDKGNVSSYSLDGVYECAIHLEDETLKCEGIIRERYWNKRGKIVVFQIKNGFYKK